MQEKKITYTERGGVIVKDKFDFNDFKAKSVFYHSEKKSVFVTREKFATFLEVENETYVTNFSDLNLQSYAAIITHTIFPYKIEGIPMIGEPSTEKLYRWVKASERLPNNDKPVFAKDAKGAKSASFYSRQHQTPVEDFDDTGDLDSFNDTLYLKEGWYEETEQSSGQYDIVYQKRKITEWLEEYTQPKALITDAEIEKMAEDAGYPQSDKESFECTYWTLHNVFTKGFKASQSLKWNGFSEEDLRKAMLHASYETLNNKCIISHRNIDEYIQSLTKPTP